MKKLFKKRQKASKSFKRLCKMGQAWRGSEGVGW